jgi:hypothetical protein
MSLHSWLATSFVRQFPRTPARPAWPLAIDAALNEQFSFQVVLRAEDGDPQRVGVEVSGPAGWGLRVRRVGYVPLLHHNTPVEERATDVEGVGHIPGYVPDPLLDENAVTLPADETHAFWITIRPGRAASPGHHAIRVRVCPEKSKPVTHHVRVRLHDVVLEKRRDFAVTHWFYSDALMDWYKTDLFDARFWEILPRYVRDVVEHGQDTLYVPVFTPPLDGVKRATQLLRVARTGRDRYRFDWRDVARYVAMARQCGVRNFEWCHFFTQWGVKNAIRVYDGQGVTRSCCGRPARPPLPRPIGLFSRSSCPSSIGSSRRRSC